LSQKKKTYICGIKLKTQFKMKKLLFTAIAVCGFAFMNAQDSSIKVNPLALLGGSDLVSYEMKLGEKSSGVIGAGIGGYKFGGFKYSSFGGELQYRYYFTEAINGWYGAGQAGFTSGKVKTEANEFFIGDPIEGDSSNETKFSNIRVGAKVGYQWIFDSGLTLDLNLGAAYNSFSYKDDTGVFSTLKGSGILPFGGFGVGYSF
jgi:Protein of unknown function (DUF3575)